MAEQPRTLLGDADVASAARGDDAAFAALYRDIQPRLRRYAWSLVGQDADDVTADAWLQVARDIRNFSGDLDGFRAWTARIVRNRAVDHIRAAARRPADPVGVHAGLDEPVADAATVALDALATTRALDLICSLPRDQAEAVLLRAVVGLDSGRAGEVLGKSAVAVRVSAHRGLRSLAKRLAAESAEVSR